LKRLRPADRRDAASVVTTGALLLSAALAWAILLSPSDMTMAPAADRGSVRDASAFIGMWGVMMAAMMLPSAMPMMMLYRAVSAKLRQTGERAIPTLLFAATYLSIWSLAGVPVYAASRAIEGMSTRSAHFPTIAAYAVGIVLIAAGVYQLSAFKHACLRKCKSPLQFLTEHWRSGYGATFFLAIQHSLYCQGCCAALMVILVAAGAMNIIWVLIITMVVFAEKILPYGEWAARIAGFILILLGVAVMLHPELERSIRRMPGVAASSVRMP
jgi:predicted metal-binding membrane protein